LAEADLAEIQQLFNKAGIKGVEINRQDVFSCLSPRPPFPVVIETGPNLSDLTIGAAQITSSLSSTV